ICGAASFAPDMYVKRVPASRTSSTQNESCFEALPHFPGVFGFCGIGIGITANSRYTANGGNFPRDPTHNPLETRGVHQIRRTWSRTATPPRFVCVKERKFRASEATDLREAPLICWESFPTRRYTRLAAYAILRP